MMIKIIYNLFCVLELNSDLTNACAYFEVDANMTHS